MKEQMTELDRAEDLLTRIDAENWKEVKGQWDEEGVELMFALVKYARQLESDNEAMHAELAADPMILHPEE